MPKRILPMERREIIRRLRKKQSIRGISRETGLARETIRDIHTIAEQQGWLTSPTLPTEKEIIKHFDASTNKTHPLDHIKDKIKEWVQAGYTFVVITQLVKKYSFDYNEITIRRYIKANFPKIKPPVIRRTFLPGKTAEVDFGYMGLMYDITTKRNRKVWLFSLRLNYSRKAYRELVFNQKAETFFQCHIHAFEYFGGVPEKIVCDNLKAGVIKASLHDPLVNKAYRMLAEHYGFLISPCQPGRPEHKGGVEKDVDYVKRNFLPLFKEHQKDCGREIPLYQDGIIQLMKWCMNIDDNHTVKYTNSSPLQLFDEESDSLLKLPLGRWDIVTWHSRIVGDDWKIRIDNAFYSVPYKYIGKDVTVYINTQEVVIFFDYEEIARHSKATRKWERKSKPEHAPPGQEQYLSATSVGVRYWASRIGESTRLFVDELLAQIGVDGLRPARGVCHFEKKYGKARVEKACQRALYYRLQGYKSIKNILIKELDCLPLEQEAKGESYPKESLFDEEAFTFAREASYFDTP